MSAIKLASRYAKSILDLSIEKGQLENVLQDMKLLNQATDNSRDFYLMLKSPIVNGDKKLEITKEIFRDKLSTITTEFMNILMRKNREAYLPEIIDAFLKQYNQHKNITEVKVTTAQAISSEMQNEIINRLRSQAGLKEIELSSTIDESLIGGYVLQWEDKLIDTSIARGLAILKDEFDNNDYVRKF